MRWLFILAAMLPGSAHADMVLAAHTIRAQSIISAQDLVVKPGEAVGVAVDPAVLIGQEARVAIYAGRPVRLTDVGPPAVVDRNQIVPLIFQANGLRIATEGRSLSRAGVGEYVRVMNLSSRMTVTGQVLPDGRIMVSR